MWQYLEAELFDGKWVLLIGIGTGVLLCFVWIFFLKFTVSFFVYLVLILVFVLFAGGSFLLFWRAEHVALNAAPDDPWRDYITGTGVLLTFGIPDPQHCYISSPGGPFFMKQTVHSTVSCDWHANSNNTVQNKAFGDGGFWHDAMVCWSRLQLAAPTGRSPFAALPLDPIPHRRWFPLASHHPVTFLFLPVLTFPLYIPFLSLVLSLHRPWCPSASPRPVSFSFLLAQSIPLTSLSFPLVGCATGAPGLSLFHFSVLSPHRGGQQPSPLARCVQAVIPNRW